MFQTSILTFISFLFIIACSKNNNTALQQEEDVIANKPVRAQYGQPMVSVTFSGKRNPDEVLAERVGYVHATDRFFQMDVMRKVARGKLSMLFGEAALGQDINVRSIGLPLAAERSWLKTKTFPDTQRLLSAYARGINEYIRNLETENPGLLAVYRRLTGDYNYRPDPWKEVDSTAVGNLLAFMLSSDLAVKMSFSAIWFFALDANTDKFNRMVDLRPIENITILPPRVPAKSKAPFLPKASRSFGLMSLNLTSLCDEKALGNHWLNPKGCNGFSGIPGSNNWAIKKEGTTYMANDPHLPIGVPSTFIEFSADSTQAGGMTKIAGMGIPGGGPSVLIGHNSRVGWVLTNNDFDDDQLYLEKLNEDGTKVLVLRGDEEVEVPIEVCPRLTLDESDNKILVRQKDGSLSEYLVGGKSMNFRCVPGHGPVVSDLEPTFNNMELPLAISYKWTGHEGSTELVAIHKINAASNFQEFKGALQHFEVGAQNFVYADIDGNIGYYSHAKFPVRKYTKNSEIPPIAMALGDGTQEWEKEYRQDFPELYNPPTNRIVTANQDPVGHTLSKDIYNDYYGFGFDVGSRARRIDSVLAEAQKSGNLSLEKMYELQYDHKDLMAVRFIELLKKVSGELQLSGEINTWFNTLLSWDGEVSRKKTEPVAFYTIFAELSKIHFSEYLSPPSAASVFFKYKMLAKYSKSLVSKNKKDLILSLGDEEISQKDRVQKVNGAVSHLYNGFLTSAYAARSLYHQFNDALLLNPKDPKWIKKVKLAVEKSYMAVQKRRVNNVPWGNIHKIEFRSILDGISEVKLPLPSHGRDGSSTTVDMGGTDFSAFLGDAADFKEDDTFSTPSTFGPNFRLVLVIEHGKGFKGYNVIPMGNSSRYDLPASQKELLMYIDGLHRDLVGFNTP